MSILSRGFPETWVVTKQVSGQANPRLSYAELAEGLPTEGLPECGQTPELSEVRAQAHVQKAAASPRPTRGRRPGTANRTDS